MTYQTFTDIIKNWPGGTVGFAEDAGVPVPLASSWRARDILPSHYWYRLVDRAAQKGFVGVDLLLLAKLEAARKGAA